MRLELTIYEGGGVQGGGWLSRSLDDSETVAEHAAHMRRMAKAYLDDDDGAAEDVARVLVTVERGDVDVHEVVPTLALRQMMALLRFVGES